MSGNAYTSPWGLTTSSQRARPGLNLLVKMRDMIDRLYRVAERGRHEDDDLLRTTAPRYVRGVSGIVSLSVRIHPVSGREGQTVGMCSSSAATVTSPSASRASALVRHIEDSRHAPHFPAS
ncbi:hypothetical protein GCM10009820_26080 [Leifsonia soli]